MQFLSGLEKWLAGIFAGTPKISDKGKKSIAGIWPWVAVVFGVLQLYSVWILWDWGHRVNQVLDNLNSYLGTTYGTSALDLNIFYWISLAVLALSAIILLAAFPKLRKREKGGWDLLFLGALANLVYGGFSAFNNYGGGGSLVIQVIVTAVVLYLLFQIRDQYHGAHPASGSPDKV